MKCPSCHEKSQDQIECSQCHNCYCARCQPFFDYSGQICQACQEANLIGAVREDAYTAKLRKWFNKPARAPVKPRLGRCGLPWNVQARGGIPVLCAGDMEIAEFKDQASAEWACRSANSCYELSGVAMVVYNRIRAGEAWFKGDKNDVELWQKVKEMALWK